MRHKYKKHHKAEKKKSFDAVVKDEKRKNTESWYNDIFEKVASVYLNLPVTENEMTRKYPGEILCENIATVPENIDLEVAMSLFRKDGVATKLDDQGRLFLVYRAKEVAASC